ncbi:glycerophosphodiester phosphodiesterase family protein [Cumulibacter soli]|uniref:glycerophosphodiester phosphodiesterase family protein n=1 Tax=Cumulibacter soli TaxID=2546344 RepID=UPI00106763F4|nr:glycerophosphodiester phosphodiesterase family protein [Cumulibacter soli]
MSDYLGAPSPVAFAHRGGAWDGIENSFEAVQRCVDIGYRYIETDVHLSKDGKVVAVHDPSLDRTTDRTGRIRDLNWSEISKARIGGTARIPLLEELLEEFPDLYFNIDAKVSDVVVPLVQLVQAGGRSIADRVCLASFSDARLRRMRTLTRGQVATSMGQGEVARLRAASFVRSSLSVLRFGGQAAQVPMSYAGRRVVDRRFVESAHQLGKKVHVWTVDDPDDMRALLDLGVDGIITDKPDVLKAILQDRGQWHS